MRLRPADRLGPYEIVEPLGAGGMGEVYRARDTRLDREVAIKVLPTDRLADPHRRWRFVQEAKAASALSHPHIVTIHEIETLDGIDFLVMERVPGRPLDALIPRGGMPAPHLVRLAVQIADALAAAHDHGIVHCDIKPANLVVAADGGVKVLDFGLATLVGAHTGDEGADTLTAGGDDSRTPVGTPGYMSPKQVSGRKLDGRTDIFSFGALLYQMATGRRPFVGDSIADVHAAVLRDQPPAPRSLVPALPEPLQAIIVRCLRKDPDRRFQNMRDVRVELLEVADVLAEASPAPVTRTAGRRWMGGVAAAAAAGAVAAVAVWWPRAAPPPQTIVQVSSERWASSGSFSPDGTQIAYASAGDDGANWDIRLKMVDGAESRRLTSDPGAEDLPAWSPDGSAVAFLRFRDRTFRGLPAFSVGTIHLVSPMGGPIRQLSEFLATGTLSWAPDGRYVAAAKARSDDRQAGGIYVVSTATGEARAVTSPVPPAFDRSPGFSPDGRQLAYASCAGTEGVALCDVRVVAIDADARPIGAARRLPGPLMKQFGLAWSRDGRSIFLAPGTLWRVRADGTSPPEPLGLGPVSSPSVAAGRDRLAFVRGGDTDIYELRVGGSPRPLVRSAFADLQPRFSPDGRRIAFASDRAGGTSEIWLAEADGGAPVQLTHGPGTLQGYPGWSPDGRRLVFDSRGDDGHVDIWTIDVSGATLRQITRHPADDTVPSFSHDGRFIYFASNRSGRNEIWRVPSAGGAEEQMTRTGGSFPTESRDGRLLYYKSGGGADDSPLGRLPAGDGDRTDLPCVVIFGYDVGPGGIVHHECGITSPTRPLRLWDPATRRDRLLGKIEADWVGGLSISPDGTRVIYGHGEEASSLMMIDHLR